jgi:hypothetical protein
MAPHHKIFCGFWIYGENWINKQNFLWILYMWGKFFVDFGYMGKIG